MPYNRANQTHALLNDKGLHTHRMHITTKHQQTNTNRHKTVQTHRITDARRYIHLDTRTVTHRYCMEYPELVGGVWN